MKTRKFLLIAATATLLVAPGFALANQANPTAKTRAEVMKELDIAHKGGTHQMNSEILLSINQSGPEKTRAAVMKELDVAHRSGTHQMDSEVLLSNNQSGEGNARESVLRDLATMTAVEKRRLHEIYLGAL